METYVCKTCGGTNVWADAWVDINTQTIVNTFDNWWCEDCESETSPVTEKEFNDNQCRLLTF